MVIERCLFMCSFQVNERIHAVFTKSEEGKMVYIKKRKRNIIGAHINKGL